MVNPVPRTLAARYEVGELIGRGGMAEVHIGHDNRLGRTVAIKILRSDLARDPSFQARFRREAQAAASLNHPAIVAVYDTGEDITIEPTGAESHIPFIVMEYVEGHTVRDILRDGNAVPIEEAIEITAGVLSALEYSHHAGIVHRDIKPANVMLTPTGAVKVMDFGIARAMADSAATMTQTHSVIGTAQYLSPEQARGESVDTRSDLYSTGCLLYELLTGRPPFTGDSPVAVAYQHVRELAAPPSTIAPDVPPVLDQITLKSLAKDRNDRYSTAAEFRAALEAAARGEGADQTNVYAPIPQPANDPYATQVMSPAIASPATQAVPSFAAGSEVQGAGQMPWQQQQPASTDPSLFDGEDEDEGSSKKRLIWTLVTVGVVALLAIFAIIMINGNKEEVPQTLTVPSLTGLTEEKARARLAAEGFKGEVEVLKVKNDDVKEGEFVESDPAEGEELELTGAIELTFSTGPNATTVPDVSGLSQDEATEMLKKAGLVAKSGGQEHSPTVAKNQVIRTEPKANTPAAVNDVVTIFVSDGFVELIDFTGKLQAEAEDGLTKLGLKPIVEEIPDDRVNDKEIKEGTVLSQSQTSGAVEVGTEITIEVAIEAAIQRFQVPNLVGKSYEDAEAELTELQLIARKSEEYSDSVPAGQVISTFPQAGREAVAFDTIDVKVSLGPNTPQPTEPSPPEGNSGNPGDQGGNGEEEPEANDG